MTNADDRLPIWDAVDLLETITADLYGHHPMAALRSAIRRGTIDVIGIPRNDSVHRQIPPEECASLILHWAGQNGHENTHAVDAEPENPGVYPERHFWSHLKIRRSSALLLEPELHRAMAAINFQDGEVIEHVVEWWRWTREVMPILASPYWNAEQATSWIAFQNPLQIGDNWRAAVLHGTQSVRNSNPALARLHSLQEGKLRAVVDGSYVEPEWWAARDGMAWPSRARISQAEIRRLFPGAPTIAAELKSASGTSNSSTTHVSDGLPEESPTPERPPLGESSHIGKRLGGRPPKYDWDALAAELIRRANHPDGLPDRAQLTREIKQW